MVNSDSICQCPAQLPSRHRRHGPHLACRRLRQYWRPDGLDGNLLRLSAGDSYANADCNCNCNGNGNTVGDADSDREAASDSTATADPVSASLSAGE